MQPRARVIAFYLPQFHPIPENDEWWGKGFTEWTNVVKAKPLFKGHQQPKLPGEIGFYDLRVPEVREQQANLAREHGIEGFCYWHYWLGGGKRLLERPFQEVLESGKPDFPFCLGWANHDWAGKGYMGDEGRLLAKQEYHGKEDYEAHFEFLLRAFKDPRYICLDDEPVLVIYRPEELPQEGVLSFWREKAKQNGFRGLHIIGDCPVSQRTACEDNSIDGFLYSGQRHIMSNLNRKKTLHTRVTSRLGKMLGIKEKRVSGPYIYKYKEVIPWLVKPGGFSTKDYPVIIPNWDTTPRLGHEALIFHQRTPELFRQHVRDCLEAVKNRRAGGGIVFLRAWNEWAEGNYLEPDSQDGRAYLEVLRDEVMQ